MTQIGFFRYERNETNKRCPENATRRVGSPLRRNREKNTHDEMSLTNANHEVVPTLHPSSIFRSNRKGIFHCYSICNYTLPLSHLSSVRRIRQCIKKSER
ncbi:hypothetical protein NPIL_81331 [Nephila pilipes]|uniref:Uncharacterized protein n=1 Tax=Nephila pilipes TaxID=299642 RepID=A0A8X6UC65_NEPPI|nr:hypothetical protein NPIL_81331 [Nephila pilipes]